MAANFDMEDEMVPTEQHRLNAEIETVYSVIISGVDHCVNPKTLKAKVVSLDANKKPKKSRQGVVFTEYVKPADMKKQGLVTKIMSDVATPKENLASLNGSQKKALNLLKKFINSNQVAAFWHNGTIDNACEFNGMHLHLIVGVLVSTDALCHCRSWRTVRKELLNLEFDQEATCKPVVKTQKVDSLDRLLAHLVSNPGGKTPSPRLCIGVNNIPLLKRLYAALSTPDTHYNSGTDLAREDDYGKEVCNANQAADFMCDALGWQESANVRNSKADDTESDPYIDSLMFELGDVTNEKQEKYTTFGEATAKESVGKQQGETSTRIPESKTYKNTMVLVKLMKKFRAYDKNKLFKEIVSNMDDYSEDVDEDFSNFNQIICHPQQKLLFDNATSIINMQQEVKDSTYLKSYLGMKLPMDWMSLSVGETAELYLKWCKFQNINPAELALDVYLVLSQYVPKKNTLYLQGGSDAGKTYWINSLIPNKSLVGEMITSQDFAFQECINKELILINELVITTPEQADLHKKVWEGQPTTVNIKNKAAQIMGRKPVLCTSNHLIWQFQTNERIPFLNRCFSYLNLKPCPELIREYGRPANPNFWQETLKFIDDQMATFQNETVEWGKLYELLDQGIHEQIELLSQTPKPEPEKDLMTEIESEELLQTPPTDPQELNIAVEQQHNRAKTARRRLTFDDTDGTKIKAARLSIRRSDHTGEANMNCLQKLSASIFGKTKTDELVAKELDVEVSSPSESTEKRPLANTVSNALTSVVPDRYEPTTSEENQ